MAAPAINLSLGDLLSNAKPAKARRKARGQPRATKDGGRPGEGKEGGQPFEGKEEGGHSGQPVDGGQARAGQPAEGGQARATSNGARAHSTGLQSADAASHILWQRVRHVDEMLDTLSRRDETVRALVARVLLPMFPTATVTIFGSSASGLRGRSSDVDLCVTLPEIPVKKTLEKRRVFLIANLLSQSGAFSKIEPIARASVPVVKCFCVPLNVNCDIVPSGEIGVHNSALLKAYSTCHPLSRQLILLVKLWASQRKICNAAEQHLSSYGHVLTCIHFCLAGASPPLVDDLLSPEAINRVSSRMCRGFDVRFGEGSSCSLQQLRGEAPGLATMALQYFEYMLQHWQDHVLSLRAGDGTFRFSKHCWGHEDAKLKETLARLSIEDPFEGIMSQRPHDIGRSCTLKKFKQLRQEWERAAGLLRRCHSDPASSQEAIDTLLEEVHADSAPQWVKSAHGRRVDSDGEAYTALEFLEYYGSQAARRKWLKAKVLEEVRTTEELELQFQRTDLNDRSQPI